MPHILSSSALDLLFNLELSGRVIPKDEVWFDGSINPGVTETITKDAVKLAKTISVQDKPVMVIALLKLDNDPLLGTITLKYNYVPPVPFVTNTYTSRNASSALHTFALPIASIEVDLAATATDSAGTTLRAIYDLMSYNTALLFSQIGTKEVEETERLVAALTGQKTTTVAEAEQTGMPMSNTIKELRKLGTGVK